MTQPTLTPDHSDDRRELIDLDRSVDLDDQGLPGFGVAVTITPGGTERFVR